MYSALAGACTGNISQNGREGNQKGGEGELEEERPEVKAELEVEKITDGYADCAVKLIVAERQGK